VKDEDEGEDKFSEMSMKERAKIEVWRRTDVRRRIHVVAACGLLIGAHPS